MLVNCFEKKILRIFKEYATLLLKRNVLKNILATVADEKKKFLNLFREQ